MTEEQIGSGEEPHKGEECLAPKKIRELLDGVREKADSEKEFITSAMRNLRLVAIYGIDSRLISAQDLRYGFVHQLFSEKEIVAAQQKHEELLSVLEDLIKGPNHKSDEHNKKASDIYGGFGSVNAVVDKEIFVIYGGIDRQYNLQISVPTVIVTYGGLRNNYTATGEDTLFITYGGPHNIYSSGDKITTDQFKERCGKSSPTTR